MRYTLSHRLPIVLGLMILALCYLWFYTSQAKAGGLDYLETFTIETIVIFSPNSPNVSLTSTFVGTQEQCVSVAQTVDQRWSMVGNKSRSICVPNRYP